MSRSFYLFQPPPPPQQLEDVYAPIVFKFLLFVLMTLIASIITFSKEKKIWKKKNVTLDPRHGTLPLDMEPWILDPRQKDRLTALLTEKWVTHFLHFDLTLWWCCVILQLSKSLPIYLHSAWKSWKKGLFRVEDLSYIKSMEYPGTVQDNHEVLL